MKELKKLSLKEEIDKQAEKIEKEVCENKEIEDMKVSEDMETSLFSRIQEYEYDKRIKKVHRRKKKRMIIVALAAVLVLAMGSMITGVGSKPYWRVLWDRVMGDEEASVINIEDMDSQKTEDIDEINVYKEINQELGVSAVRLRQKPENMYLERYSIDGEQRYAILFYNYNNEIRFAKILQNTLEYSSKYGIRIRLSSVEPIYFDDELISLFKNGDVLCPHTHIPLQSGSNKILSLMNRRYTREDYIHITEKLYKTNTNMSISSDVMVGFPHEDNNDFNDTYDLCEQAKFIKIHIFRYSNRENTPSSKMDGQVGYRTKLKRAQILNDLNNKLKDSYYKNAEGRDLKIVIEKALQDNNYIGTSSEYLKCKLHSENALNKKDLVSAKSLRYEGGIMICE